MDPVWFWASACTIRGKLGYHSRRVCLSVSPDYVRGRLAKQTLVLRSRKGNACITSGTVPICSEWKVVDDDRANGEAHFGVSTGEEERSVPHAVDARRR